MRRAALFAVLASALVLGACGGKQIERTEQEQVLKILRSDKFEILDPQATSSGGDVAVLAQMYEGLVRAPQTDGSRVTAPKWEPSLAVSWEIKDNAKDYTFTLRENVKFHDGEKLTAAAVKKSFERLLDRGHKAAPVKRPYAQDLAGIKTIEVVNERTVRFLLDDNNPRFLANVSIHAAFIISPKSIDEMAKIDDPAKRQKWLTDNTSGTGPYRLAKAADYRSAESCTLTAFDDYWDGKPKISLLSFIHVNDHKSRREQVESGSAHFTDSLLPSDWEEISKNPAVTFFTWEAINLCYLAMNCDPKSPFITKNKRVRDAIAMAINRDDFVRSHHGTAKAAHVLIPYTMPFGHPEGYKPETDRHSREGAIPRARTIIREEGVEGTELTLIVPPARPYLLYPGPFADLIAQQLRNIGLRVKLELLESMAPIGDMIMKGSYPLMLIGWMGDNGEPDNFWGPLLGGEKNEKGEWIGPGGNNTARFFDITVQNRIVEAAREADPARRDKLYKELEQWVHDQFRPIVPLLTVKKSFVWSAKLKGVRVDTGDQFYLNKAYFEK